MAMGAIPVDITEFIALALYFSVEVVNFDWKNNWMKGFIKEEGGTKGGETKSWFRIKT